MKLKSNTNYYQPRLKHEIITNYTHKYFYKSLKIKLKSIFIHMIALLYNYLIYCNN